MADEEDRARVAIRPGLLVGDLAHLDRVRLAGSRCEACGETSLGERGLCPNCGSEHLNPVTLSDRGILWTYTISRHRPPGDYRGPDPFVPFAVGLVELPDGLRVMTPVEGDLETMEIGQPVRFAPYVRHDEDRDVVAFCFASASEGNPHV